MHEFEHLIHQTEWSSVATLSLLFVLMLLNAVKKDVDWFCQAKVGVSIWSVEILKLELKLRCQTS